MKLEELKNRKIVILGFGREGLDNYLALRKLFPKEKIGIADKKKFSELPEKIKKILKNDKKAKLHLGDNYLNFLKNYDVVIKTPGIPIRQIKKYLKKEQKVTSQTEIFLDNFKGTVIGVTGTKGKGTTVSLIYSVLKSGGKRAKVVGNIGKPVFQELLKNKKNCLYVYEMSSHQLENLKISPQIAVFLNLSPAHLDYYSEMSNYIKAKENIFLHQKKDDILIYNDDDKILKKEILKAKSKKIKIKAKKPSFLKEKDIPLIGDFNFLNISAAVGVGKLFGISKEKMAEAIKKFKPLPHRLEFSGEYKGIKFYNDSLATVPKSVELAVNFFDDKLGCLIFGGQKIKGIGFKNLAGKILKSNLKVVIALPETGKELKRLVSRKIKEGELKFLEVSSMKEAVRKAYQLTKRGKICLLSPGSPSFNLFKNYKDRGDQFKKWVNFYGKQKSR